MWSKNLILHAIDSDYMSDKLLHWLDAVKEKDIAAELEFGTVNMPAMEAIMEHLNVERANDRKGGGIKYDCMAENMTEFNRDFCRVLVDKREGEAQMKIKSVRDGDGLWANTKFHH